MATKITSPVLIGVMMAVITVLSLLCAVVLPATRRRKPHRWGLDEPAAQ